MCHTHIHIYARYAPGYNQCKSCSTFVGSTSPCAPPPTAHPLGSLAILVYSLGLLSFAYGVLTIIAVAILTTLSLVSLS